MVRICNYEIMLSVAPEESSIVIEAVIKLSLESKDVGFLAFNLHKEFLVDRVETDRPLEFDFPSDDNLSNTFMPDARPLRIYLPRDHSRNEKILLKLKYSGPLKDFTSKWKTNRVTQEWTELGLYSAWFPVNLDYGEFTYSVLVKVPDEQKVVGLGKVSRTTGGWLLVEKEKVNDIVVIASPRLKRSFVKQGELSITLHYVELNQVFKDYLRENVSWLLRNFQSWFGGNPTKRITIVVLPKLRVNEGGGYARKDFVVLPPEEKPDEESFRYIAHEIAHLWWTHAPSASWEDWLNESFAEYSALMALRERFGDETFHDFLARKSEKIKDLALPPIFGLRREDENAFNVLYNKGPVILGKLESKVGKQTFIRILRESSKRKVRLTSQFMDILNSASSQKNRNWFEKLLES
jgi:hypothetical protein